MYMSTFHDANESDNARHDSNVEYKKKRNGKSKLMADGILKLNNNTDKLYETLIQAKIGNEPLFAMCNVRIEVAGCW